MAVGVDVGKVLGVDGDVVMSIYVSVGNCVTSYVGVNIGAGSTQATSHMGINAKRNRR